MSIEVSFWFPSIQAGSVLVLEGFGIAGCLGWAGVRLPSKGRLEETVAAPVVPCGFCVVGLAPAHTAAVWLSVWATGDNRETIHTRSDCCLQPLSLYARSL